jgi:CDP-diacylglycerol---serine O-phosphatidyltransferase
MNHRVQPSSIDRAGKDGIMSVSPEPRRRRLSGLPFNRMIPNILTLMALCAGLTALRFGLNDQWELAVLAIFVAAILDGLDGRIARILKGSSKFGAELDSLSDFVCFGVAPGLLLYLWTLESIGRFGWMLSLLFAICCALRLARFNTALDAPPPSWAGNFFTGVPAPAGGGLVMLPIVLTFQFGDGFFREPAVVAVVLIVVSALMVSKVPTFSGKRMHIPHGGVLAVMLITGVLAAGIISAPWITFSALGFLYIASIPISIRSYRRLAREHEGEVDEAITEPEALKIEDS